MFKLGSLLILTSYFASLALAGLTQPPPPALPISVVNGGFGQSMVQQTNSSSTVNALSPGVVKFTFSGTVTLNGIAAPSTNLFTYIAADGNTTINVMYEASAASAANRIVTPGGHVVQIPQRGGATLYYDTANSRWTVLSVFSLVLANAPLSIGNGVMSISQSSSSTAGYLSAADWNVFNNKLQVSGGVGVAEAVPFFSDSQLSSPPTLFASDLFTFNLGTRRLQVGGGSAEAVIHGKSALAQQVNPPSGFTANLTQFVLPVSPTITVVQTTPDMQVPAYSAGAESGSGYNPGDTVNIDALNGYDDGMNPIVWGHVVTTVTGISDSVNPFDIQNTLTDNTQNFVSNVWVLSRTLNGGAVDYLMVTDPNYLDNSTGWSGTPIDVSNVSDDFVANGHNFGGEINAHGTVTDPMAAVIVDGAGYSPSFADDNSSTTYKMSVQVSGVGGDIPANIDWPGTRHYTTAADFVSGPIGPTSPGAAVVTPNTYGLAANGSNLGVNFSYYSTDVIGGTTAYSSSSIDFSFSDPGDANYYYIALSGFSPTTGKLVRNNSDGRFITTSDTLYYDGTLTFPANPNVIPSAVYIPAVMAEGPTGFPQLVIKDSTADDTFAKASWQNSDGVELGTVRSEGANFYIQGGVGQAYLALHQSNGNYSMGTTSGGLGSFSANALTLNGSVGGTLATNSTTRMTWDNDGLKINGASTGYESGLEVRSKSVSYPAATFQARSGQTGAILQALTSTGGQGLFVSGSGAVAMGVGLSLANSVDVALGTGPGTKIGTGTTQKLAFYNSTPVVQQTGNPVTALTTLGLLASPTAVTETQGGTNQTTYTQGDVLYASGSNALSKLAKSTSSTRYLSNTGTSNNPAWAQVDLSNGVTGTLAVGNGGSGRATAISAPLSFTANLTSIASNQIVAYGKLSAAATIQNMVAEATSFTCVSNPTLTLYDCGTSAGACTTGRTALASVTLTASGGADGTVTTAGIAAGHYWAVETTGGTCTTLTTTGTADYQ